MVIDDQAVVRQGFVSLINTVADMLAALGVHVPPLDLSTTYLGLHLKSPLMPGASPLVLLFPSGGIVFVIPPLSWKICFAVRW